MELDHLEEVDEVREEVLVEEGEAEAEWEAPALEPVPAGTVYAPVAAQG